jgi:hypothetical protein
MHVMPGFSHLDAWDKPEHDGGELFACSKYEAAINAASFD